MKRRTPPRELTEAFANAAAWHDGCWLAGVDLAERPCSGRLEAFHFVGRQRIRNTLSPMLTAELLNPSPVLEPADVADLVELAEWDTRNAGPACVGHHRRFDNHLTPGLRLAGDQLPDDVLDFLFDWGLDLTAEQRFGALPTDRKEAVQ